MGLMLKSQNVLESRQELCVERLPFLMGRGQHCDFQCSSPLLSRSHCLIHRVGERYLVQDLESKNGTYVNQVKIDGYQELFDGDLLTVGVSSFVVELFISPLATSSDADSDVNDLSAVDSC